jgi:hypothetical protein
MKYKTLLILLLFIIPVNLFSQSEYYHNLRYKVSQPFLLSWNVDKEDLVDLYVVETVDSKNRVIEIRMYEGESLYPLSCKIPPIIKYEYKDNMIIVHRYESDGKYVTNVRCGKGQKTVFYIENRKIVRSVDFIVDFDAFKPDENSTDFYINYFNEKIKPFENGIKGNWKEIPGYGYSLKKMNMVNPAK